MIDFPVPEMLNAEPNGPFRATETGPMTYLNGPRGPVSSESQGLGGQF